MIPSKIKSLVTSLKNIRRSQDALRDDRFWLSQNLTPLSSDEKRIVNEIWKFPLVKSEWIWRYHMLYKTFLGFDCNYVPGCVYYPYIIRSLNPAGQYEAFENKALFSKFIPVRQPKTVLKKINGVWYDDEDKTIGLDRAVTLIDKTLRDKELIFKPATGSCCGRGIEFLSHSTPEEELKSLFLSPINDIVLQEVVSQSASMSELNPTSLNCLRISTLNLNGSITVVNSTVKIGGKGVRVDNIGGGNGGCMFGVENTGMLTPKGITNKAFVPLPEELSSFVIPNYSNVLDFAKDCHRCLPHIGLAGWDIALDSNDNPVMIEGNMWWPGIMAEQIAGPFFGERTGEVLDYMKVMVK